MEKKKKSVHSTKRSLTKESSGVELVSLAPSAKRHMPKARPGFEAMADLLSNVARANPDAMGTEGIELVDQLATHLADAAALTQPCRDASAKLQKLEETRFVHNSKAWVLTLTLLDRARSAGRSNPDILHAIVEVDAFLKHKKTKAKTPAPAVSTPPVA